MGFTFQARGGNSQFTFARRGGRAEISAVNPPLLTENNVDGATLTVTISGATFNAVVTKTDFELFGDVPGISIDTVSRTSSTVAVLTLDYDGTDFDTNRTVGVLVKASGTSVTSDRRTRSRDVTAIVETSPAAPDGLAGSPALTAVTITWDNLNDLTVSKFQYQQSSTSAFTGATWTDIPNSGPLTTSYTVTGLTRNTEYYFRLRAVTDKAPPGPASDSLRISTLNAAISITTNPASLTEANLKARTIGQGTGVGEWDITRATMTVTADGFTYDSTLETSDFELETGVPGLTIHSVSRTSSTVAVVTLEYDINQFMVADSTLAVKVKGSAGTLTGEVESSSVNVSRVGRVTAPTNPTDSFAWDIINASWAVHFRFAAADNPPTGRTVINGGEYRLSSSVAGISSANWVIFDTDASGAALGEWLITPNTFQAVQFRWAASNGLPGESSSIYSYTSPAPRATAPPPITVTPPRPGELRATAGNAQVVLRWGDSAGATGWQYRQRTGSGSYGSWINISGGGSVRTFTVTGLTNGTSYAFQVRAAIGSTFSSASNEVTATPAAATPAPSGFTAAFQFSRLERITTTEDNPTVTINLNFAANAVVMVSFRRGVVPRYTLASDGRSITFTSASPGSTEWIMYNNSSSSTVIRALTATGLTSAHAIPFTATNFSRLFTVSRGLNDVAELSANGRTLTVHGQSDREGSVWAVWR